MRPVFCCFDFGAIFSVQILLNCLYLYGKGSESFHWGLFGNCVRILLIWKHWNEKNKSYKNGAPLFFLLFRFSSQFFIAIFVQLINYLRKGSEKVRWWFFGRRLAIPLIWRRLNWLISKTPEIERPSTLAFWNFEPIFQRDFPSIDYFSGERDQKKFVEGCLEIACVYF